MLCTVISKIQVSLRLFFTFTLSDVTSCRSNIYSVLTLDMNLQTVLCEWGSDKDVSFLSLNILSFIIYLEKGRV
jgi:hypothetical protein